MTPKERTDARTELHDMAYEMERKAIHMDGEDWERGKRMERARLLRNIADELKYPRAVSEDA